MPKFTISTHETDPSTAAAVDKMEFASSRDAVEDAKAALTAALPWIDAAARAHSTVLAHTPVAQRTWAMSYAPIRGERIADARTPEPLGPWLALLIALLFSVERWLATTARRVVAR